MRAMKRFLSPLVVIFSLFIGTGIAAAAIRAASLSAARIVLETGGGSIFVSSVSGIGFAGKGPPQGKNAAPPAATPVDVKFNAEPQSEGLSRANAYLSGKAATMDATIKLLDFNNAVKQVISLGIAPILELQLPGGDAQEAKMPVAFRFRLQPRALSIQPGSGTLAADAQLKAKSILSSNFRVSVNGIAEQYAMQVLPATVRRVGKELQISGLGVTLPQTQALSGEWQKWSELSLAGAGSDKEREKTLKVEYLDATLATVVLTLEFTGVGIEAMELQKLEASSDQAPRVTFRMYARGVTLK